MDFFQQENTHLQGILKILRAEFGYLKSEIENLEEEYKKGLKEASETGRQDDAIDLIKDLNKMMDARHYSFKKRFIGRVIQQVNSPYFTRLDFVPLGYKTLSSVYVGKHAYASKDHRHIISDWRSPIASLYYNYPAPTPNASYTFLDEDFARPWIKIEKTVKGDLLLRRNIDIEDSKLLGVYDNNLKIDLVSEAISEKTGGILSDIIETIQSEQNEIIRSDPYRINIIQGTAGSGKTTIAIHRLSYLFYTYKDIIKENNTLLISTTNILINYVAKTLPELEIYTLRRSTLEDFIIKTIRSKGLKIAYEKGIENSTYKEKFKNSPEFIEEIKKFAADKKKSVLDDISSSRYFKKLDLGRYLSCIPDAPLYYQINLLKENVDGELGDINSEKKEGFVLEGAFFNELAEASLNLGKLMKDFDPVKLYKEFIQHLKIKNNAEIEFSFPNLNLDDLCGVYILADVLLGLIPNENKFTHVVVDEAQDIGLIGYEVIKRCANGSSMTILGDINQSTQKGALINDWKDLEEILDPSAVNYFFINVSYRTTKQIILFARKILEKFPAFKYLPEPFRREGEEPVLIQFDSREKAVSEIVMRIKEINKDEKSRAIAVIEPDPKEINNTLRYLKNNGVNPVIINEKFDDFKNTGVYLVPENLVKGLEFDTVFLLDPSLRYFPVNEQSAKRLFVCCSRAINRLFIYYSGELNPLLATG